ncbi:MAG: phosphatidylserine decarboxylase [Legionellales bacterium]|nr:phosphatidylserine decarboxylase [Legionellales bacterium]|tara:strand:- start:5859 stop:6716 length:858 start_codon:yes stop_codon:yes gene_type:complete
MLNNKIKTLPQYLLPQHLCSRLFGKIANSKLSWLKNYLIKNFIRKYHVNMDEAERQDINTYISFNDFFTRKLKRGARPIDGDHKAITSPADGTISQIGTIQNGQLIQAKGRDFSLTALVANQALAKQFDGGNFATIYLSPKDYHRVHMPVQGVLQQMSHIPGKLFSVNNRTAETVDNLFARNERIVSIFKTEHGPMAVIMIGAFFVASIHMSWAGTISPARAKTVHDWDYTNKNIILAKGDEVGHFKFGSTAIVLFPANTMTWQQDMTAGTSVMMGQQLGQFTTA